MGAGLLALTVMLPRPALAQLDRPMPAPRPTLGEDYRIELGGTLWNPSLSGIISSEQFDIVGSDIDFEGDLGYTKARFRDLRIVLRPGKKHRFRVQYTPIQYSADTTFTERIVFNGIAFDASLPISSQFDWKVLRIGYEYDFIYTDWGFIGALFEVRHTKFEANLATIGIQEFAALTVPLPAFGIVGRAYVLPEIAINFELSGLSLPEIDPKYAASYFDLDIHGTVNLTRNLGMQVGWRRLTTYLNIERDIGDLKFQGMWFGAAVRY